MTTLDHRSARAPAQPSVRRRRGCRNRDRAAFADLSDDEQARLLRSKTDYRELYERLKDVPLPVSRETGALLYMLARSARRAHDRRVRDVVRDLDAPPRRGAARQWRRPPHHQRVRAVQGGAGARQSHGGRRFDLVEIREGDALETLATICPRQSTSFCSTARRRSIPRSWPRRKPPGPGALIVADNADMSPDYLERVRSPDSGYLSVPFGEDVELSMRVA